MPQPEEVMRVVVVYNRYLNRGGEDEVFEAEAGLLARYGHRVVPVSATTQDPAEAGPLGKSRFAVNAIWSRDWYGRMLALLDRHRPDLVHVHNVFPTMSPAVYHACRRYGAAVVQTLHNFRHICPAATCYRDGAVCEDCVGRVIPWPGVVHGCYHGSRGQTAVVAMMLAVHRMLGTWTDTVDAYIALTGWARRKFIQGGIPADRIVVKPNFVHPDPGPGEHRGDYALFVGRLSTNKGLGTLLTAWRGLRRTGALTIVGDGPLNAMVASPPPGVRWIGRQPRETVLAMMREARILVCPSEWYEGFPLTIAEAFATGLPVVASRLGAMAEVIEHGRTGLHFEPGDALDLAAKVEWALDHPGEMATMGRNARQEFETKFTAERNYETLTGIYRAAAERAKGRK